MASLLAEYKAGILYKGVCVILHRCFALPPNGLRYRRLGRKMLGNGKLPEFRTTPKKRAESQPSGARLVRRTLGTPTNLHDIRFASIQLPITCVLEIVRLCDIF